MIIVRPGRNTMFDHERIERAVRLQQKSYALLKWLNNALGKGGVSFDKAHDAASESDVAREWIHRNRLSLPATCCPQDDELQEDCARFISFLY